MRTVLLVIAIIGWTGGCSGPRRGDPDTRPVIQAHTTVSLTFDDALADQAQLGPMLAARGMRATFYVNSGRLGLDGRLTLEQVRGLAHAGHEIAGHTVDHPHLPTLTVDQQQSEICDDRAALTADGITVTSFAYPFGDSNAMTEQIVAGCGYTSARGVGDLLNLGTCDGCPVANSIPPVDPFNVKTHASIKIDTSIDAMEAYVLEAERIGGWLPMVFHHVCDGCDPLSVSPDTLAAFLDWLAARGESGTVVETVADVMVGPSR